MTSGKSLAEYCKRQIGTPYSKVDCTRLIVNGIRNAQGASGESLNYACAGTNELWRSIYKSGKYRYVTERVPLAEAKQRGMLVPGRLLVIWEAGYNEKYNDYEGNCSHIAVYVGDADCEAVHSSKTRGMVAATTLKNGFTHVLSHRLIDLTGGAQEGGDGGETGAQTPAGGGADEGRQMIVATQSDPLNVRSAPGTKAALVGKAARGSTVTALGETSTTTEGGAAREWIRISFTPENRRSALTGWACAEYLAPAEPAGTAPEPDATPETADNVSVPRDALLKLADALNEAEYPDLKFSINPEDDRENNEKLVSALLSVIDAGRAVTAYLKGDD